MPRYRIVILVAGTRGDVQPAVALALALMHEGHCVRLATHEDLKALVTEAGVPFHPLHGSLNDLTKVTVQSRGIIPSNLSGLWTIRQVYKALIFSCFNAVTCPFNEVDGDEMMDGKVKVPPLLPDLIITTPITYGVSSVAESLQIPIHIISATPWYPSQVLSHPWARLLNMSWSQLAQQCLETILPGGPADSTSPQPEHPILPSKPQLTQPSRVTLSSPTTAGKVQGLLARYVAFRSGISDHVSRRVAWMSTTLLDHMLWYGIEDILEEFRVRVLGLPAKGKGNNGWCLYSKPHTFTFSSVLCPRPPDWPDHITVSGPLLLETARALTATSSHQTQHPKPCSDAMTGALDVLAKPWNQGGVAREPASCPEEVVVEDGGDMDVVCPQLFPPSLPDGVEHFLKAGAPPVYVGFGSSSTQLGSQTLGLHVVLAALASDTRVVINRTMWHHGVPTAWEDMSLHLRQIVVNIHMDVQDITPSRLEKQVLLVDELPHHLLLPRCAACVHQGGAGTVNAGLLAGCPTLVCPVYGDQFFWADLVHRVGAGPAPIPAHTLNVHNMTKAFTELQSPLYVEHAKHLSCMMREECEQSLKRVVQHVLQTVANDSAMDKPSEQPSQTMASPSQASTDIATTVTSLLWPSSSSSSAAAASALRRRHHGQTWVERMEGMRTRLCRFWYG